MVYLLYGEDNYLKTQYLKKLKKSFGDIELGINYIQIDENNVQDIISDIETPAFGYETKLIVAKNCNLFVKKNPLADKIADYIKNNNIDDVMIIFVEEKAEKNTLFNTIKDIGKVLEFSEMKMPQIIEEVKKICRAYRVNIDNPTAQYFVECTGTNMQDIINEIRKLIEFAGTDGTIKREDIDALTIKKSESIIFDLTDNLGKKNIKEAITVLHNLEYAREPVQMILIMLYRHFKKLYIVKLSKGNNVGINLKLKPNQTFLIKKYTNQASYFKEEELENIINALIKLDESSKNGNIDLEVGLETILCRYCS